MTKAILIMAMAILIAVQIGWVVMRVAPRPEPTNPYTSEGHRRLNPEMFDPRPMATWDYPLASDPRHRNEGH
jgi:hypothetical protein